MGEEKIWIIQGNFLIATKAVSPAELCARTATMYPGVRAGLVIGEW